MNPNMYKPGMVYEKVGFVWGERLVSYEINPLHALINTAYNYYSPETRLCN